MDYSEKSYKLVLTFTQEGAAESILDKLPEDHLPIQLVRGFCTSLTEPAPGRLVVEL